MRPTESVIISCVLPPGNKSDDSKGKRHCPYILVPRAFGHCPSNLGGRPHSASGEHPASGTGKSSPSLDRKKLGNGARSARPEGGLHGCFEMSIGPHGKRCAL